ncbi:MAG: hypothetical protein JJE44_12275 [Flavobacteriaceae bacterium]|nr:hypothetical protein [Flavobacteriaceae bacterium]
MKNIFLCGVTNKNKVKMNDMMNENNWGWGMGWGMWLVSVVIILVVLFVLFQNRRKE